jgi:hypothetical protein
MRCSLNAKVGLGETVNQKVRERTERAMRYP